MKSKKRRKPPTYYYIRPSPILSTIAYGLIFSILTGVTGYAVGEPVTYTASASEVVEEPKVVLLETHIDWTPERIEKEYREQALAYGVNADVMWNTMSRCENTDLDPKLQSWHPDPNGPNGRENSWGISQINLDSHPDISREQAQDPAFAAEWTAKEFASGNAWKWTCWRDMYQKKTP